jgi:hypothetical protein
MDGLFQIGSGAVLIFNSALLLKLSYQAGKLVQKVDDHDKALNRHDQELRDLRENVR